jgi:uncharacterized protein (DUF1778 family)
MDDKIYIRIPVEEKKLIQEAARKSGRTMSNYIRWVLSKSVKGDK